MIASEDLCRYCSWSYKNGRVSFPVTSEATGISGGVWASSCIIPLGRLHEKKNALAKGTLISFV